MNSCRQNRRQWWAHHCILLACAIGVCTSTCAADLAVVAVDDVASFLKRANQAASTIGQGNLALGVVLGERLRLAAAANSSAEIVRKVQETLEPACLLQIGINPESRVKVEAGPAELTLAQGRWRYYLVKIVNEAGVTAPLRFTSDQALTKSDREVRDKWLEIELFDGDVLPSELSGERVDYRVLRLRADVVGKRAAVIAADVGQGTADIGFRNDVLLTFVCNVAEPRTATSEPTAVETLLDPRLPTSENDLQLWLENMVYHHRYTVADIQAATGLSEDAIGSALNRFGISSTSTPQPANDKLLLLPYPGGKHPRIGFLEGAVRPQRETKASVFLPWDPLSYVVLDVPEAIWSNLGLTYLAHEHIPTIWDQRGDRLEQLEWMRGNDGSLECERTLPNGITFGVRLTPTSSAVRMEMWLVNGSTEKLSDLRVQNCVLLKFARGFEGQTNDNKVFWGRYAACRNAAGNQWIISAWDPVDRAWGNPECPCLHSDPKFPECPPGQTRRLTGWLSFYSGTDVYDEMLRIESTGWRLAHAGNDDSTAVHGVVVDEETSMPIPARVHLHRQGGDRYLVDSAGGDAVHYERSLMDCAEVHTTLSADPFVARLPPGDYTFRIERGKEYMPLIKNVTITEQSVQLVFRLRRWINMAERGWYSGDVHVHRSLEELPNVIMAEDLNVALPLTYWVTQSDRSANDSNGNIELTPAKLIEVDAHHVIYPVNTEYEISSVGQRPHHLGAVLALNHRRPFAIGVPPTSALAAAARREGALLDLEKHSWPWSLMIVPVMGIDLFELANNHVWQTGFGLKDWTLDKLPPFMDVETTAEGFTEAGWIDFGFRTYYTLLNSGFRLRVSAGTASGVHPVPVGFGRVYVYVPERFDYDRWVAGLDAGHSFVTTGPLLDVRYNDQLPGHTFQFADDQPGTLRITGSAESRRPLARIEIIKNGRVHQVIVPTNRPRRAGGYASEFEYSVQAEESSWYAVRCFATHPQGRTRFAHTNPVFIDIAGKPLRPRRVEVDYLIHRMQEEIETNRHILTPAALAEYQQALSIYQTLAEEAR